MGLLKFKHLLTIPQFLRATGCYLLIAVVVAGCALRSYDADISSRSIKKERGSHELTTINYGSGDVYRGPVRNGKPSGTGTLSFKDGRSYKGEFVDGYMQGKGQIKLLSGAIIKGEFKNDALVKAYYENGNVFSGDFTDYQPAVGEMQFPGGTVHKGNFINGRLHGNGEIIMADGRHFRGSFDRGARDGVGTEERDGRDFVQGWDNGILVYEAIGPKSAALLIENAECLFGPKDRPSHYLDWAYQGDCRGGRAHGAGTITNKDGLNKVEGEFIDGDLISGAHYRASDGLMYEGTFKQLSYSGYGRDYLDGKLAYVGQFKGGLLHGKGECAEGGRVETCQWAYGKRIDQIHKMREEQARIEKWESECDQLFDSLGSSAQKLSKLAGNTCANHYKKIQESADWAFQDEDTMYYLSNSSGWIASSVEKATQCRQTEKNNADYYARNITDATNSLRAKKCPQSSALNEFTHFKNDVMRDISQRHGQLVSMEQDYVSMERKARAAAVNRIERERREMWQDTLNKFQQNLQQISTDMNAIYAQTNVLVASAYKESSKRQKQQQELQARAYNAQVQQFRSGYAKIQSDKLAKIKKTMSAQPKMTSYDWEKKNCEDAGKVWNNGCDYSSQVVISGWGPTTTAAQDGKPGQSMVGGFASGGSQAADGTGGGSTAGTRTASGGASGANQGSSGAGTMQSVKEHKPAQYHPVFKQFENPYSWGTEAEACKYAKAESIRRAESSCRRELEGRRARDSDSFIQLAVDANCQGCRKTSQGYKCMGNVILQCVTTEPENCSLPTHKC